jgi:predicted AlkP superfamily phosphohydrolase/phosphomutase
LEEGFINEQQFLALCEEILQHRERTLMWLLDRYNEGVFACVFDSLDRIQHMFLADRADIVEDWYVKLDAMYGRVAKKLHQRGLSKEVRLITVSDHGFGEFKYKVHLNRWLIKQGYLASNSENGKGNLNQVDWGNSEAYAVGLNSIYLNLNGREGQGKVTGDRKKEVLENIKKNLMRWVGPEGGKVVRMVYMTSEVMDGPLKAHGPDLVVGYEPGFRASAETGMGEWGETEIVKNQDQWQADHCFDGEAVPGVVFSTHGLGEVSNPSYSDFPSMVLGKEINPREEVSAPEFREEEQEKVDERLRELGYL